MWLKREHSDLPPFGQRYHVLDDGPKPIVKFFVRRIL